MRVDVYHHFDGVLPEADRKLNQILALLQAIKREDTIMMQETQDLITAVNGMKTVDAGAVAALNSVVARLLAIVNQATDLAEAKAAMAAAAADINSGAAPLAAAIANVPA